MFSGTVWKLSTSMIWHIQWAPSQYLPLIHHWCVYSYLESSKKDIPGPSISWVFLGHAQIEVHEWYRSCVTPFQWIFQVPLKGGRWHIIPQLAVYTTYIPLIYCLLGGYIIPTTLYRNLKNPLTIEALNLPYWALWKLPVPSQRHQFHCWKIFNVGQVLRCLEVEFRVDVGRKNSVFALKWNLGGMMIDSKTSPNMFEH